MNIRPGDIDIDLADRTKILEHIEHVAAAIKKDDTWVKHNTGIYVTAIPKNPVTGYASLDYVQAEERGYIKIDLINNSVYQLVRDRAHLTELVNTAPDWKLLNDPNFFQQVVHIGNHYNLYQKLAQPVSSLEHMAMFLALIRPAKRALVGRPWSWIEKTIWEKSEDGSYGFKKSHAMSYSLLVAVHVNLLSQSV